MKKLIYLLFLLCFTTVQAQNKPSQRLWRKGVKEVRVISFNICDGFIGNNGRETERENRLIEWVKQHDPEILAMQELCGFNQKKLSELAKKWGHQYVAILKEEGYPVGITSKEPITVKNRILKNCGHGLLHVQTFNMNILVTHLNPGNTKQRNIEAHTIVNYIKENNIDKCLLMGDMNSHSPFDADLMEERSTNLIKRYNHDNLLNGNFDYSVISHFMGYPLIDICRMYVDPKCRTTFPSALNMSQSENKYTRMKGSERIDFIFATPDLAPKAVDGFIWNEESDNYLSDHYPIGIDLLIYPQKAK